MILPQMGFHQEDVYNASHCLEKLVNVQYERSYLFALGIDPLAMRIYTKEESRCLDTSCRGFLLFLE